MGSLLRDLWDVFAWLCLCEDPPAADESNNAALIQNQGKGVSASTSSGKVSSILLKVTLRNHLVLRRKVSIHTVHTCINHSFIGEP